MVAMPTESKSVSLHSPKRLIQIVLMGFLVTVAFDFFQHAGLFAKLWLESTQAFLPPEKLFQRIPLGYIAFLLNTILITWLIVRLNMSGWKQCAWFGIQFGLLSEAALVLGTMSGFPVKTSLLIAWFFGGVLQYCIISTIIGSGLVTVNIGRLWVKVIVFIIVLIVITIALQSLGYAPAMNYAK